MMQSKAVGQKLELFQLECHDFYDNDGLIEIIYCGICHWEQTRIHDARIIANVSRYYHVFTVKIQESRLRANAV